MPLRAAVALPALLLALSSCSLVSGARREGRLREALEARPLPRPCAAVWPDALRVVAERGYELVGADRDALGLPALHPWRAALSKGFETRALGAGGRVLESGADADGHRYRVEGREAGGGCEVRFLVVTMRDGPGSEETGRDAGAELELLRRVDPEAAAAVEAAAGR
jgi:hypothetical protein